MNERLIEAIQACDVSEVVKGLEEMTGVLHALFMTMEEFRTDVVHALRNMPHSEWATKPTEANATISDALSELLGCAELNQDDIEPETRELIAKVHAMVNPLIERIDCARCGIDSPPTLAAAVELGWTDLHPDEGKMPGNYEGICPTCRDRQETNQHIPESVSCDVCDATMDSLAEALQEGWTGLTRDNGPSWNFLATCPTCQEEEAQHERKLAEKIKAEQAPKTLF